MWQKNEVKHYVYATNELPNCWTWHQAQNNKDIFM